MLSGRGGRPVALVGDYLALAPGCYKWLNDLQPSFQPTWMWLPMSWRTTLRRTLAVVVGVALVLAGCRALPPATRSPAERTTDVDALAATFLLLEDLRLVGYRRDNRCEYIVYDRGAY